MDKKLAILPNELEKVLISPNCNEGLSKQFGVALSAFKLAVLINNSKIPSAYGVMRVLDINESDIKRNLAISIVNLGIAEPEANSAIIEIERNIKNKLGENKSKVGWFR